MVAELMLVAALVAGDGEPSGPRWRYDCDSVRRMVDAHGEAAVVAIARARGVPEKTIQEARRSCLRR